MSSAIVIGLWAYIFTHHLVQEGEVFAIVSRLSNRLTSGDADRMANPDDLKGLKLIIWKYTYCEKCHAGFVALVYAGMNSLCLQSLFTLFTIAVFTSLLSKRIIKTH